MRKINALVLGATVALSTVALARAEGAVTGIWKLSVGQSDDPCTLTLTADDANATAGAAASASGCIGGLDAIGHWKTAANGLQLYSPSGELVAWLKPKGDAFEGSRVRDGRRLELDR